MNAGNDSWHDSINLFAFAAISQVFDTTMKSEICIEFVTIIIVSGEKQHKMLALSIKLSF